MRCLKAIMVLWLVMWVAGCGGGSASDDGTTADASMKSAFQTQCPLEASTLAGAEDRVQPLLRSLGIKLPEDARLYLFNPGGEILVNGETRTMLPSAVFLSRKTPDELERQFAQSLDDAVWTRFDNPFTPIFIRQTAPPHDRDLGDMVMMGEVPAVMIFDVTKDDACAELRLPGAKSDIRVILDQD